jgi:hypothetical protein
MSRHTLTHEERTEFQRIARASARTTPGANRARILADAEAPIHLNLAGLQRADEAYSREFLNFHLKALRSELNAIKKLQISVNRAQWKNNWGGFIGTVALAFLLTGSSGALMVYTCATSHAENQISPGTHTYTPKPTRWDPHPANETVSNSATGKQVGLVFASIFSAALFVGMIILSWNCISSRAQAPRPEAKTADGARRRLNALIQKLAVYDDRTERSEAPIQPIDQGASASRFSATAKRCEQAINESLTRLNAAEKPQNELKSALLDREEAANPYRERHALLAKIARITGQPMPTYQSTLSCAPA